MSARNGAFSKIIGESLLLTRIIALLLLLLLLPLLLVISGMNFLMLGWPVFFQQQRPGLHGTLFKLIKFRTMCEGSHSDERRLTAYGHFLRRYSLDELPALWNIIRGEMNFVGPRPLLPEYLPLYSTQQKKRHQVKPGLTGWAQIKGRNALTWDEKLKLDVWYVDNRSISLDLKILFKTIVALFQTEDTHHQGHVSMPKFEGNQRIYLSPPHLAGTEMALIQEVLDSNYIVPLGPMVDRFEKEFCEYTGYPHNLAVSSGTAALHLALLSLDVKPGDAVWASTLTFIGGISPLLFCGAHPTFVDASLKDWNMDPDLLEEGLQNAKKKKALPKAIVVTDLYGQPCDYTRFRKICASYGIQLVGDCAESLGARYQGSRSAHGPDTAIFSFNGNKIITTSGGGMLSSKDPEIINQARYLSQQARSPVPYYHHDVIGYNYRLSNVLAAIGVAQLAVIEQRLQRRREIYETYRDAFSKIPGLSMMPIASHGEPNYWLSVVVITPETEVRPEDIRLALEKENIETRPVWNPMHCQPVFKNFPVLGGEVAQSLFATGLCLPSGSALTPLEQQRIIDALLENFS